MSQKGEKYFIHKIYKIGIHNYYSGIYLGIYIRLLPREYTLLCYHPKKFVKSGLHIQQFPIFSAIYTWIHDK